MTFGALVAALIIAAPASYEVSLRSEVRGSNQRQGDAQLNPVLSLTLPFGHFALLTSYTPRILLFEPGIPQTVSLLHNGRVAGELRPNKASRIFLEQLISYGWNSFSYLMLAAENVAPSFDRLATLQTPFLYFGESTTLGIEQALSRQVALSLTAGYSIGGGADAAARQIVPVSHSPRASLRLAGKVGTRDYLLTEWIGYASFYSSVQRSYVLDGSVGWRHEFSKDADFDVLIGAGGTHEIGQVFIEDQLYPYLNAGIRRRFRQGPTHALSGGLYVRLAPAIDTIVGYVYERVESYGTVAYSPVRNVTLSSALGGAVALSSPIEGQKLGYAAVSVAYAVTHELTLSAGVRGVAVPNFVAVGFLAITVGERGHF
jgi:hypothetical protein